VQASVGKQDHLDNHVERGGVDQEINPAAHCRYDGQNSDQSADLLLPLPSASLHAIPLVLFPDSSPAIPKQEPDPLVLWPRRPYRLKAEYRDFVPVSSLPWARSVNRGSLFFLAIILALLYISSYY
jgi:hypothetical protein